MGEKDLHIAAKWVSKDELIGLLERLHNNQNFRYLITASWSEIWFEDFKSFWVSSKDWLNESQWGRAFGENAEVRWREDEEGKGFLCRWIFEGVTPPVVNDAHTYPTDDFERAEQTFLLWGMPVWEDQVGQRKWRREGNHRLWYVTRIPRLLTYPIDDEMAKCWEENKVKPWCPLCLRVRFYLREGQPIFDRFVKLEVYQEYK